MINTVLCLTGMKMKTTNRLLAPVFMVIGWQLGSRFSPAIWLAFAEWLRAAAFLIIWVIFSVLIAALYFHRIAGYDKLTSIYASLPGALASIVSFIQGTQVNERQVIVSQTVRVVMVVGILPFLFSFFMEVPHFPPIEEIQAGRSYNFVNWGLLIGTSIIVVFLMQRLHIPSPHLLGTTLMSAIFYTQEWLLIYPPDTILWIALYILGCIIGSRFSGSSWQELLHIGKHAAIASLLLIFLSFIGAVLCAHILDLKLLSLILAFVPGGVHEMTIIAFAYGIEPLLVAFLHLVRLTLIILSLPWLGIMILRVKPNR